MNWPLFTIVFLLLILVSTIFGGTGGFLASTMAMIVLTSACMYGWILRAVGLWFLLMFFVYNCFGEDMMEEVFIRQENGVVWFFEDSWPWLLLLSGILFIPLLLKKMGFGTK